MIGWLVDERGIEPHVKLMDKSERTDGALSRSDFVFDAENNTYVCPGGKELKKYHRSFSKPRDGVTKEGTISTSRASMLCAQAQVLPKRARTQDRAVGPRSCSRQGARNCQDRGLRCLTPPTKEG
jgi:hypothetical protein